MEDLGPTNSTSCVDLERLAAAAATMGYSSDPTSVSSHRVVNVAGNSDTDSANSLQQTALVPQYPSDSFDLSRLQHYATIRFTEVQPKPLLEQHQHSDNLVSNQQHLITSHQNHATTRDGTHCSIVESDEQDISRSQCFGQVMTTKNINVAQGTSSLHYFPVDSRSICSSSETLAIAVSHGTELQIANPTHINSQPVIHFVPQTTQLSLAHPVSHSMPSSTQSHLTHENTQLHQELSQPQMSSESKHSEGKEVEKKFLKKNKRRVGHSLNGMNNSEKANKSDGKYNKSVIPSPVEIKGRKYYVCNLCNEKFLRKYVYRRHQIYHTGEKRGSLSLETKAEIINRIKAGEKQVDLAMDYNVGRSTISFIMKNADKFLSVLKNGKFHPDTKRLRGAQREDVEAALYEWYKQATHVGIPVSGPILCRKARDFAAKLGYQEFKATHGWLDRFKSRKLIVLGRTKSLKEKDEDTDEFKEDFAEIILPNIMIGYDSHDVFQACEIGLLYRILPSKASYFKGTRCAGGTNSKKRITVLMCTNMTGSEKFPLLVIGKYAKPRCFRNVKSLPVQYVSNEKSWMTKENFMSWLLDLNAWFAQQNRKILLIVPNLPIHPKAQKLSAVKVIVCPSNFVGPSKLGIIHSIKRNYRRALLESFLNHLEQNSKIKKRNKKLPFKLSLLSCLHKLAVAWHGVTDVVISSSFQRSALGKYGLWSMNLHSESTLGTENLDLIFRLKSYGVKVPYSFTFDDYITFDDEVQVCHFMDDDDIIASVTGAEIESTDSEEDMQEEVCVKENVEKVNEEDCRGPSFSEVTKNFGILRNHIAHQTKGSEEMLSVLSHLEYLLHKTVANGSPSSEKSGLGTQKMENLESMNASRYGELERLAAAAATMEYTESISPVHPDNSHQSRDGFVANQAPTSLDRDDMTLVHTSRPSTVMTTGLPQVISYIEPYSLGKEHHLIPVRPFETQTYVENHPQSLPSLSSPHVLMVATNNSHTPATIQFARPLTTHVTVTEVPYQSEPIHNVNCAQSFSQIHKSSSTQIIQYSGPTINDSNIEPILVETHEHSSKEDQMHVAKQQNVSKRKETKNCVNECAEVESNQTPTDGQFLYQPCDKVNEFEETSKHHQPLHTAPKRSGLALELKIEIIKRINSGERKADMAEEYGVNASTIKSIMKKADNYLGCWKKGLFNPDSTRLKGPKREDIEEALFSWYNQALENGAPVSGPILCNKALDFAKKLGHTDFKATHGWLDRFKKRKKIVFGRGASKKGREIKSNETMSSVLPQMLLDYEPGEIFGIELVGLFYRALPSAMERFKGNKCHGGIKSKERLSIVLCSNMTGSEKFPLLVAGRSQKSFFIKNAKTLPVHYILDENAWFTSEIMSSWLLDMDSWFVQQCRKVIFLVSSLPIFLHPPKLRAIKLVVMPSGYPSPLQVAIPYFKGFYRNLFLKEVIGPSRGKPFLDHFAKHIPLRNCLQFLSSAWQSISDNVIVTSFQRSGLVKYGVWNTLAPTDNMDFMSFQEFYMNAIHILHDKSSSETTFDSYIHFDDEIQVCNMMGDDDILAKVKGVPKNEEDEELTEDEMDKENEVGKTPLVKPLFSDVENALGVLRRYIQCQEGAQEMFQVLAQLEYCIFKKHTDLPPQIHMH